MKLKIRHKLFITLFISSSLVAICLFLYLQWSFDKGFLNYVKDQELFLIENLAEQLANQYAKNNGWGFLEKENPFILGKHTMVPYRDHPAPPEYQLLSPPLRHRDLGPRIFLYNIAMRKIAGPPDETDNRPSHLYPVKLNGRNIGYIGLIPPTEISQTGDLQFVKQQKGSFTVITLAMIFISMLLSFPITIHLLRPIKELTKGTRRLIAGQFNPQIPVETGDELGQLSSDFNMLAYTLRQNEKVRRQWVADISHELRTPIAILRGEIEAMVDGIRRPSKENLDPLHNEVLHLQRLISDLYELSMSDIGAQTYKKIEVNPAGILEEVFDSVATRFSDKGLQMTRRIPSKFQGILLADPDRLQQLFSNLFENSLRYTDSPGSLTVSLQRDNGNALICFEDTAPGVDEEQLPHLFDRLYRTDASRQRTSSGAGLGLSICHNIVNAHQGTISVENSSKGGLLFTIHLPLIK